MTSKTFFRLTFYKSKNGLDYWWKIKIAQQKKILDLEAIRNLNNIAYLRKLALSKQMKLPFSHKDFTTIINKAKKILNWWKVKEKM